MRRGRPPISAATLRRLVQEIRLIAFDFDGVFTNNRVLVGQDGSEFVLCNRADGIGLERVRKYGVRCLVLSSENNSVVARRCEKLRLECHHGLDDKWKVLERLLRRAGLSPQEAAYVGNDINDLTCMARVGFAICVADAYPEVKSLAHLVTRYRGGEGAVREVCDLFVRLRSKRGNTDGE